MRHPIVAVTGLNATDNPGPGVAIIKSLRSSPAFHGSIVGLAYDALDPGLYLDGLLDAAFLIPYPSAGREALLARLAHIQATVGIDVLIPALDSELPGLADHEEDLEALGIHTFLPTRAQLDMRSKAHLHELDGLLVPDGVVLTDPEDLYTLDTELGLPLVVKGPFYGATVAHSVGEAVTAFHTHAAKWGYPIIVQRYVEGEERNVCAVGDGRGGVLGAVAMKKLMLTDSGKGWAGVTIRDPALMELTRTFMEATGWRGPCELEVRRDADGQAHLIEVNPRFPAWCDLCPAAGQNHAQLVVDLALGGSPGPLAEAHAGTAFVRISLNQIVPISAVDAITTIGEVVPLDVAS